MRTGFGGNRYNSPIQGKVVAKFLHLSQVSIQMALWYECGKGMVKTTMARWSLNMDVYLCCPGPSLAKVEDKDLHVPGAYVCAINTAYPKIRPDIWVGMDVPECYDNQLWWESFVKITRGGYQNKETQGKPIKDFFNVFFADCKKPESSDALFKLRAHDVPFVWHKNTLAITLHILVWMGAKRIYLLGCDMGGSRDYYHGLVLSNERRKCNHRLYAEQTQYMKWFYENGLKNKIHVISCTPDSPLNEFMPYLHYKDALEISASRVPEKTEVKHVLDARKKAGLEE